MKEIETQDQLGKEKSTDIPEPVKAYMGILEKE
jgi:hypothetical protein